MSYRVGIDIGGTFTDFALLKGSEVILHKNLSTPADRSIGVIEGLRHLAASEGKDLPAFLAQVDAIIHGTTVADNTLIEMNGACTGLLTTAGYAIDTKHVQTQVLVENGGTVVIGGIFVQTDSKSENKVPLLGDLPVLGHLFKNTSLTSNKSELLIFLTPKVVSERSALR